MDFQLDLSLESLARTPLILEAFLRGRSAAWVTGRKSPEAFSPVDVVGHLILAENTNWMPRLRLILAPSGHHTFDPFDRFAFQQIIAGRSVESLLEEFAMVRKQSLQELASLNLSDSQLALTGHHPDFGTVTLGNLLATWVVHDLGHVTQIAKTMAHQYRDAVGPWRAYLGILH